MNNRYSWPYNLAYDIFGEEQKFREILPMRLQHVVREELSARESKCIHLRYAEGQTYDTIAKSFNVTIERIRQIVMYYEVTFNGDKKEWYLDAYKKFENQAIADSEIDDAVRETCRAFMDIVKETTK